MAVHTGRLTCVRAAMAKKSFAGEVRSSLCAVGVRHSGLPEQPRNDRAFVSIIAASLQEAYARNTAKS